MKKAFIQKLSIAMASALVITAAAPATADAASAMAINKKSKVLYLNQDNMTNTADTFDFNIKNKPANYKTKYKFNWSASNSNVKVNKSGIVTAAKVGKTTVKCDIIKKSTGKVYKTVKATVEVKANADKVTVSNAPENGEIAVGSTFDFNRTMVAANGGKATDKTEWVLTSDAEGKEALDPSIATIDNAGVVTALQAGEFYVFAKTYQSKATKELGYTAVSEGVKVNVPLQMTDVKLTKINTVELTFDSSVKDVIKTKDDVKIETVAANRKVFPVKSVKVSEDGKTVEVLGFEEFVNDTTYSVTAAKSKKEFKAVVGEIATLVVEDQTVAPIGSNDDKAQVIKYTAKDANGVDVTAKYSISGSAITANSTYNNGSYVDQGTGKMFMRTKGDVVTVQLTYVKYNPTTGADESIKSNVATITCAEATALSTSKWTIAAKNTTNESKVYDKIVTSVNAKDYSKKLFVTLKDSYNNDIKPSKYTSQNTNILLVTDKGELIPQAAGTALVKVEAGNYYDYLTITVNSEAVLTGIVPDNGSFTLSNTSLLKDQKAVKLTLKDNYSEKFINSKDVTVTVSNLDAIQDFIDVDALKLSMNADKKSGTFVIAKEAGEGTLNFVAKAGKKGSAVVRFSAEGKTTAISVSVVEPTGASDYRVDIDHTDLDNFDVVKPGEEAKVTSATVKVFNVDKNNVLVSQVTSGSAAHVTMTYAVKNAKGEVVNNLSGNFVDSLSIDATKLAVGTYTVEIAVGPTVKTAQFTVKSTKAGAEVDVKATTVKAAGADLVQTLKNALTFKVNGNAVESNDVVLVAPDYKNGEIFYLTTTVVTGSTINWGTEDTAQVFVQKVRFTYDGVTYEATVGETFTINK